MAALPRGACKLAEHCIFQRSDAEAVAAAEQTMAEGTAAGGGVEHSVQAAMDYQRLLRCVLRVVLQACKVGTSSQPATHPPSL